MERNDPDADPDVVVDDTPTADPEAPEADALEQAQPVPFDEDEMRD